LAGADRPFRGDADAFTGRIAGVSGIAARLFPPYGRRRIRRTAGVCRRIDRGTAAGYGSRPAACRANHFGRRARLVAAGLLVGFGSVWGNGCTSGHGVCGISRLSVRSLVATATFMVTGS